MNIRKIEPGEFSELKKLQNYAFGKWEEEVKEDKKLDWFKNADNIGVYEDDELVSALINHDFEQVVRKDVKRMGGLGGIATYPEYRNKGFVSELMKESFAVMKDNDQSVSMLFPFKETFYERYQYVSTNNNMKLVTPLISLKHYKDYDPEGDWEIERRPSSRSKDDFLSLMRKVALKKYHGFVLVDRKADGIWHVFSKDQIFVFIKRNDKIVAAAKYTKKGFQDIFETGIIDVSHMYWVDIDSRNMMFKYFAKHLDQIEKIKMYIPYGINYYSWLKNNKKIEAEIQQFPWMVRIIKVEDALSNIHVPTDGSITIRVKDKFCPWNNNTYELTAKNSTLTAERTNNEEHITIPIDALSALLYGAYSLKETEKLYPIDYDDKSKKELLKEWFPQELIYNTSFF